jgi:ubiquinone/menaquinone biosynthesis C-methylase UbiE
LAEAKPERVLETAAGTGVVTRAMASRLPPTARVVATDLNEPMLNHARAKMADDTRISWKPANAQALPFKNESFDAVVCQFGAMFFPDKVGAYKEARRVLKPNGLFIFNVWDKISENDFANVVAQALAQMFPDDPPRFMERTPHGYHDPERIRGELASTGFSEVSIDAQNEISRAPTPHDAAVAYCQGTPWRSEIEARDASRLEEATDRAADAIAKRFGTGPVDGRIRAFVITAAR